MHRQPNLRREIGAHVTDALRIALLRARGYSVGLRDWLTLTLALTFATNPHRQPVTLIVSGERRRVRGL